MNITIGTQKNIRVAGNDYTNVFVSCDAFEADVTVLKTDPTDADIKDAVAKYIADMNIEIDAVKPPGTIIEVTASDVAAKKGK